MAVTPNYGWPIPVATDYVKDGYDAIADLGNAIDTTVAGLGSGLTLVKTQTIGSAVSSVIVSSAFSATYDAYKIIIAGGTGSANTTLRLQMRAGSTTETGSLYAGASSATIYSNGAYGSDWIGTTATNWTYVGYVNNTAGILSFNCDVINPFLTDQTTFNSQYSTYNSSRAAAGLLATTTSYDSFVISPETGTITGGEIRVYGYQNS